MPTRVRVSSFLVHSWRQGQNVGIFHWKCIWWQYFTLQSPFLFTILEIGLSWRDKFAERFRMLSAFLLPEQVMCMRCGLALVERARARGMSSASENANSARFYLLRRKERLQGAQLITCARLEVGSLSVWRKGTHPPAGSWPSGGIRRCDKPQDTETWDGSRMIKMDTRPMTSLPCLQWQSTDFAVSLTSLTKPWNRQTSLPSPFVFSLTRWSSSATTCQSLRGQQQNWTICKNVAYCLKYQFDYFDLNILYVCI